jgi:hypothetical protein
MTFKPVYKCRLCGVEYTDPREFDYDINELLARLVGLDEDVGYSLGGHSITITESHICNNRNVGIAELKGFIVVERGTSWLS